MRTQIYRLIALIVTGLLLLVTGTVYAAPPHQAGETVLQSCENVDQADLQGELNRITQDIFASALDDIDLPAAVAAQWAALGLDKVVDAAVDKAVLEVKSEKDLWGTFLSGWSASKAEELAREVATRTFDTPAFRTSIDELSTALAGDIAVELAKLSADSTSNALACLQSFIRGNFADAILVEFEQQVQADARAASLTEDDQVEFGILSMVQSHQTALGGVGVIIASYIARAIVQRIGRAIAQRVAGKIVGRIVGRVGSSVIPIAGWIIGAGLIAYDIYDGRDGALPQIQEALKSEEVKAGIRAEIVAEIEPELRREMPNIAREIANSLNNEWDDVQRRIRQVLELAEENPHFHGILNELHEGDLPRLVKLVDVALPALTREGVRLALENGSFAQLLALDESAYTILMDTKSIETVLAWRDAVGADLIDEVATYQIYKHKAPVDVGRNALESLLAVDDPGVIQKLILLDMATIEDLTAGVSSQNLKDAAVRLSEEELGWLAQSLSSLDQEQKNQLLTRVIQEPTVMALLKNERVRATLAGSDNVTAAIGFLGGGTNVAALLTDLVQQLNGAQSVPWSLFFVKYGTGAWIIIGVLAFLCIGILLVPLRWALSGWVGLFGLFRRKA